MPCPNCSRRRYKEKIIKKGKINFLVRICLSCDKAYDLIKVRKSKATNLWIEMDENDDKD